MRILYITSALTRKANSASIRNVAMVNGLVRNGAVVDVLTIDWPVSINDEYLLKNLDENITIYKDNLFFLTTYFNKKIKSGMYSSNKSLYGKSKKFIKDFIKDIYFFPEVDKEWIKKYNKNINFKQYDYIISSSDSKTSHFIAEKIKGDIHGIKWIQIWGDPWAEDVGIKGIRKFRSYFYEKKLLKKADKIIYVSLPTLIKMKKKNVTMANKMHYVARGFLKEVTTKSKIDNNELKITYTGVLNSGRNIFNLINAIKKFNEVEEMGFKLEIYGHSDEKTLEKIKAFDKFVDVYPPINFEEVLERYKSTNCLLYISNKKGAHQIPGKLFDYYGTNKSILSIVYDINDSVSKFIKSKNRSIIVENNESEILETLHKLKDQILLDVQKPIAEFKGEILAKKLLNITQEKIDEID